MAHTEATKSKISESNLWQHRKKPLTEEYKMMVIQEYILLYIRELSQDDEDDSISMKGLSVSDFRTWIEHRLYKINNDWEEPQCTEDYRKSIEMTG